MSTTSRYLPRAVITSLVLGIAPSYAASDKAPTAANSAPKKPAWLTDLSIGVKESFDDNVYFSEVGAMDDRESWITTIAPKMGVNLAPLIGDQKVLSVLSLGYAPELNFLHNEPRETFYAHRMAFTLKAKKGAIGINLDNGFNYIDGSQDGPIYPDGRSAYATAAARERREQIQDRLKFTLQYDQAKWFLRPNASLLYYDLMTKQRNPTGAWRGYDNYADRYDLNGGVDFGYKVTPAVALTLGYRYGHQEQEQYPLSVDPSKLSASSDYHRVLLGIEGKPLKWLTLSAQAGPDFRTYEADTENHDTPVGNRHPVKYYGEASANAELSSKDSLGFKYRQWQWVASTGKLPYFDSLYELGYKHKFSKQWALELAGRVQSSDYTWANVAAGNRQDWQYTVSAGLSYAITQELLASASYTLDLGRNEQDGLTAAQERAREFDHQIVSLGLTYKF